MEEWNFDEMVNEQGSAPVDRYPIDAIAKTMPKLSFYCTEEGKVRRADCNYHLEKRLFNFVVKSEKARKKGDK